LNKLCFFIYSFWLISTEYIPQRDISRGITNALWEINSFTALSPYGQTALQEYHAKEYGTTVHTVPPPSNTKLCYF
jgi:hypothetical protein